MELKSRQNSDLENVAEGNIAVPTKWDILLNYEPSGTEAVTFELPNMLNYSLYFITIFYWYTPLQTLFLASLNMAGKTFSIFDPSNNTKTNITVIDSTHIRIENPTVGKQIYIYGIK